MPDEQTKPVEQQNEQPPAADPKPAAPIHLPDDHPLVKAYNAQKQTIRDLKTGNEEIIAKANKFDELEEANKTEMQKLIERAEKAESLANQLQAAQQRTNLALQVAAAKGVPAELLTADTQEAMEAQADQLLAFRSTATPATPPAAPPAGVIGNADTDPANQVKQLTQADLKTMTPAEVIAADRAGQLNALKGTQ